jgi:hypothetical protein
MSDIHDADFLPARDPHRALKQNTPAALAESLRLFAEDFLQVYRELFQASVSILTRTWIPRADRVG